MSFLRTVIDALDAGRLQAAFVAARELYTKFPADPAVSAVIGSCFERRKRFSDAARWFRQAISLGSTDPAVWNNAAMAEFLCGRRGIAARIWRSSLERWPQHAGLGSMQLCAMLSDPRLCPATIAKRHREWAASFPDSGRPTTNDIASHARLRIGYVSACFRRHSVMCFFKPILENHDRTRYEIFCYSSTRIHDETTEWTRRRADHWRPVQLMSDAELAQQILSDRIDILIDLDGHFECNRLPVFAGRPASISATYLGYPFTTGLRQIDYRLTDKWADPEGHGDLWHSERLERLPRPFLCYDPRPACELAHDYIGPSNVTFGCFSHLPKLNDRLLRLWKLILDRTPESRLVLKSSSLCDPRLQKDLQGRLRRLGFDLERIEMREYARSLDDHLQQYRTIDIALDTCPYHGTTTTCEALCMGVPVVTISGNAHFSRVGCTLLQAIGRTEWIARNESEYVAIAAKLAHDKSLRSRRSGLRAAFVQSPLCDAADFVATLERTYERWADSFRHLQTEGPVGFEIYEPAREPVCRPGALRTSTTNGQIKAAAITSD